MKLSIVLLFALLSLNCFGQGNPATNDFGTPPTTAGQDISKVFSDFSINVSAGTVSLALVFIYGAAKALRTKTSIGNTAVGKFLSRFVNLESANSNATGATTLTPAAPVPAVPSATPASIHTIPTIAPKP